MIRLKRVGVGQYSYVPGDGRTYWVERVADRPMYWMVTVHRAEWEADQSDWLTSTDTLRGARIWLSAELARKPYLGAE